MKVITVTGLTLQFDGDDVTPARQQVIEALNTINEILQTLPESIGSAQLSAEQKIKVEAVTFEP